MSMGVGRVGRDGAGMLGHGGEGLGHRWNGLRCGASVGQRDGEAQGGMRQGQRAKPEGNHGDGHESGKRVAEAGQRLTLALLLRLKQREDRKLRVRGTGVVRGRRRQRGTGVGQDWGGRWGR